MAGRGAHGHQGRPLGLLLAWSYTHASYTARETHRAAKFDLDAIPYPLRVERRAWAEQQGLGALLFERALMTGESPEPPGIC